MLTSTDTEIFREKLLRLVEKFDKDKSHYLSKGYPEAQVRLDFLNPFFEPLGWDIENKGHKPPHERDVIVELSPETTGRFDYNFRLNGATKFFVEAKAPSMALDDVNHILQAKSYAWRAGGGENTCLAALISYPLRRRLDLFPTDRKLVIMTIDLIEGGKDERVPSAYD